MKVNIPAPPQTAKENEAKEDEPVKTFIVKGEQNSLSFLKGKIEVVKKWGFNKTFHLSAGSNIIGRHDTHLPSDISIKDDACVSRRSVDIQVESTPKGNLFKLKVLKSTNPVYVNNEALCQGDTVSLNFGDIIILGKTQLRFLKDT